MSTMTQLGEFLATIQNNQDVRTAELEERIEQRLAQLEAKEECGCAETIAALEERLATLEAKGECGCAETISTLEERLATLEAKEECGCGSYDELLASYEERISALEGNAGGGSTEGEGENNGSTEGEGGGDNGGSTEGEGGEGGSTEGEGAYPVAIVQTKSVANSGCIYALPKEGTAVAYFRPYTTSLAYEASNKFATAKAAELIENEDCPVYALMSDNSLLSISSVEDIGLDPNSDEDILIKYIPCNSANLSVNLYLINGERYGINFGVKTASIVETSSGSYDHHFIALQAKIDELNV